MAEMPSETVLLEQLRIIIAAADLATTSPRQLRTQLAEHFGVDLSEKKAFLKDAIARIVEELDSTAEDSGVGVAAESDSQSSAPLPSQPAAAKPPPAVVIKKADGSEANDADVSQSAPSPTPSGTSTSSAKPKKRVLSAAVIGLSDDSDVEDNDSYRARQRKSATAGGSSKPAKRRAPTSTKNKPKSKKPRILQESSESESDVDEETREWRESNKSKGAYATLNWLKPELAEFMGQQTMTRAEATKRIWAYIKEKNLERVGKNYKLDEALSKALGRKTLNFGTTAKAIKANMLQYHSKDA